MQVEVYYNLSKKIFSIRDFRTKRVIEYAPCVLLQNVVFHVSEKGRERVLKERRKNVHAWVRGERIDYSPHNEVAREAYYNPYTCKYFQDKECSTPLIKANYVWLENKKIFYTY